MISLIPNQSEAEQKADAVSFLDQANNEYQRAIASTSDIDAEFDQVKALATKIENQPFDPTNGPESCSCTRVKDSAGVMCSVASAVTETTQIRTQASAVKEGTTEILEKFKPKAVATTHRVRHDLADVQAAQALLKSALIGLQTQGAITLDQAKAFLDKVQDIDDQVSQAQDQLDLANRYLNRAQNKADKAAEADDLAVAAASPPCPMIAHARMELADAKRKLRSSARNAVSASIYGKSAQETLSSAAMAGTALAREIQALHRDSSA